MPFPSSRHALLPFSGVVSAVSGIASRVKSFIGFSEPEEGPLSNFSTYAPDMMKLFAKGIKDNEHLVTDQIRSSFDFGNMTTAAAPSLAGGGGSGGTTPAAWWGVVHRGRRARRSPGGTPVPEVVDR